ncbi:MULTISPECIES: hypothetical protein [Actinoalloteichus]|nr:MULTISPECIES: hypothetical protein [Actinoalloteichus]
MLATVHTEYCTLAGRQRLNGGLLAHRSPFVGADFFMSVGGGSAGQQVSRGASPTADSRTALRRAGRIGVI